MLWHATIDHGARYVAVEAPTARLAAARVRRLLRTRGGYLYRRPGARRFTLAQR